MYLYCIYDTIATFHLLYFLLSDIYDFVFSITETNQELIMTQGGIGLLSTTAANAKDPQTLRMVAGAIANLCGNGKLLAIKFIWALLFWF